MHNFFDIRTLSLFSGFISACLFASMIYIYRNRKTYPGFKQWTFAYMLNFLGFVFLSLRNILPDFITVILANFFIVFCFVLIARGLIYFSESEQNIWMDISPLSVLIITFLCFVYFIPNVSASIVVISLTLIFIVLRCAFISHRKIALIFNEKNWLLITTFILLSLWLFLRAFLNILFEKNVSNFILSGSIQGFSIIIGSISHIFIAIGLVIINAQRLEKTIIDANKEIKTLRGFLPICSYCKKIRDDKGFWNQIETYVKDHSDAYFSNSICPECAKKHYPDIKFYDDK
jgi:hypothetical protein